MEIRRDDLVRFRFRRHQLDRQGAASGTAAEVDLLDYGVQDTGPDGAAWALAIRGGPPTLDGLALAWTWRGGPHAYRRDDMPAVSVATAPYSEADAAKRVFDASKPLKDAGIPVLDALKVVAEHMRDIVREPTVKGDLSAGLTERLDEPYLRNCRPCGAIHAYEQPFRLAALQAGLELDAGTSPPVLRRIPRMSAPNYRHLAAEAEERFDPVRNHLRFYPGASPNDVAGFLDAPLAEVKAHWPDDAVEVVVDDSPSPRGPKHFVLEADLGQLSGSESSDRQVRLLGPFDPYLQLRDRTLLVGDEAGRKDLWRVLGRPGAIVADGEVIGTWRPKANGARFTLRIQPWGALTKADRTAVEEQAERLAAHRGATLAAITED